MPTPFDTLTAASLVRDVQARTPAWMATNAAFVAGDHWQGGAGWVGPSPVAGDPSAAQVMSEIARAFISRNALREVVQRHTAALIGHEPAWSLTLRRFLAENEQPNADEQARIAEAEAALTAWWDERGAHQLVQAAAATLLWAERAALRLYVPRGLLVDGAIPPGELAEQLARIYLDAPAPAQAELRTDPDTQRRAGVYLFQEGRTVYAEVCAVDDADGMTVLRVLGPDGLVDESRLDLGGRLLLHEATRAALITEPMRQHQKLLNLARTMLGRNVVLGGFLERVLLNAQVPGHYETDSASGLQRFVAEPFRVGAGTTNFLMGAELRDATGQITGYANPSVVYRDPVPVDTFERTSDSAYRSILAEAQQLHAMLSSDASASGESRRQAMADFLQSLLLTQPALERLVRWLLETTLALAAYAAGVSDRYADLRAVVTCRLDPGPIPADELRLVIDLVAAQIISRQTAMARAGVADTDAETALVTAEQQASATLGDQVLRAFDGGR